MQLNQVTVADLALTVTDCLQCFLPNMTTHAMLATIACPINRNSPDGLLRMLIVISGRLESFFGAVTTKHSTTGKRKELEVKGKAGSKKAKIGGVGKKK